jgi:hypothetical protein
LLILGVTIFDTTLVTISRSRRGLLPFATPGKDHAAHRLANLGLGQRGAVLALYVLGATGGALAVLVSYISAGAALVVAVVVIAAMLFAVAMLENGAIRAPAKSGFFSTVSTPSRFAAVVGFAILTSVVHSPTHSFSA